MSLSEPIAALRHDSEMERPVRLKTYIIWASVFILIGAILIALLRSSPAAAADPAVTIHTEVNLTTEWSILQYPAVVLQQNGFRLRMTNSKTNEPLEGATINVKLAMLDMICGDYDFELRESSPGIYEGDGVPLMPGLWRATAVVKTPYGDSLTIVRTLKAEY